MGIAWEATEGDTQAFVHLGVIKDAGLESVQLGAGRELTVNQQVSGLDERRLLSEFFDGVTTVAQDALLAVDEGDLGLTGARVGIAVVEGDVTCFVAQLADVYAAFLLGTDNDGKDDFLIVQFENGVFGAHGGGMPP